MFSGSSMQPASVLRNRLPTGDDSWCSEMQPGRRAFGLSGDEAPSNSANCK